MNRVHESKWMTAAMRVTVAVALCLCGVSVSGWAADFVPENVIVSPAPLRVASGRVERLAAFPSAFVEARNVDVWLPADYPGKAPYAVLYMHDGQMLFDAATTWNKQEWQVDEVAGRLMAEGKTRPFIVVGVWNAGTLRLPEYFPQRAFESLSSAQQTELYGVYRQVLGSEVAPIQSDRYLKFLIDELKPYIDRHYSVSSVRADTFIMGSSMGGLISMYAVAEYPEVFGGAACMSTHWPGRVGDSKNNPVPAAFFRYIQQKMPAPGQHRWYFDHGTETLDASYADRQREVNAIMVQKGYDQNNFLSRTFQGAEHSEKAWAARLDIPLLFLLKQ